MRRILLLLLMVLVAAMCGCSSSDDSDPIAPIVTPEDEAAAHETATGTMGDMLDDLETSMGEEFDAEDLDALMEMELDSYSDGFEDALEQDPNCSSAHFGMAFVEMVSMSQADDLQNILDEFGDEFGGAELALGLPVPAFSTTNLLSDGMMGRSFEILRRSPLALSPQEIEFGRLNDKADGPLIRNLQNHIHYVVLPRTQSIIDHLAVAESDPDFSILIINGGAEPDTVEIDLGEVYVLDAVVRALRSGLLIATAYDVELAPNGDYTWITDAFNDPGYTEFEVHTSESATDTLFLLEDEGVSVQLQATLMSGFEDLLAPGSYFLTLWTDPWSGENAMNLAYTEIQTLLAKLELAYNFIQAEGDNQDHDLISQIMLAELDEAVLAMGEDIPEYIGTWETIPDVIAWVEEIMTGPYTIPVEISETETFDLTVNISALFLDPVQDWKTKLPYMAWLDFDDWAWYDETVEYGPYGWNAETPFETRVNGEDMSFTNISTYFRTVIVWETESPIAFLDGPGGDVIGDDFLYFPDYTFGGLFPDMDRAGWLTLIGFDR